MVEVDRNEHNAQNCPVYAQLDIASLEIDKIVSIPRQSHIVLYN